VTRDEQRRAFIAARMDEFTGLLLRAFAASQQRVAAAVRASQAASEVSNRLICESDAACGREMIEQQRRASLLLQSVFDELLPAPVVKPEAEPTRNGQHTTQQPARKTA